MPVNDPDSILSYQVKCLQMSAAVHATFSLCALQRPSAPNVFKCITCCRDCVTSSELFDTKKQTSAHVGHAGSPCAPAALAFNHRSVGFWQQKVLSALLWCRMLEAAANIVVMNVTRQHVQRKRRISNAPGSVACFDLSFAHEPAVGNTKAWLQGES